PEFPAGDICLVKSSMSPMTFPVGTSHQRIRKKSPVSSQATSLSAPAEKRSFLSCRSSHFPCQRRFPVAASHTTTAPGHPAASHRPCGEKARLPTGLLGTANSRSGLPEATSQRRTVSGRADPPDVDIDPALPPPEAITVPSGESATLSIQSG